MIRKSITIQQYLDCNYDGGDCCVSNVQARYCREYQCLERGEEGCGGTKTTLEIIFSTLKWIGDIICHDINNI